MALSFKGLTLQLAYRLRRHLVANWPLSHWLGLALLIAGLVVLLQWWPVFWPALLLGLLLLFHIGLHTWAARTRYVCFEAAAGDRVEILDLPPPPPLRKGEMVPVRVSGWFAVEGRERRYMDVKARFETVGTREHIVLGRIFASRFLGLGRWPADEVGWWYIFFLPSMIQDLRVGRLCFGGQSRLALRVTYAPDEEIEEEVYITSQDPSILRRVWDDLLKDCPKTVPAQSFVQSERA